MDDRLLTDLLWNAIQDYYQRRSTFRLMSKETRNDRKIARSIAFISLHLNERITMTQLAARVGLSSSYFWALFKQKTGYAPIEFLIRLRMHQACQFLKSTDRPINEIAADLGYHDPLYFSRAFKSILGVAPSRYRLSVLETMPLPLPWSRCSPNNQARPWNQVELCKTDGIAVLRH